jgi:hypothetical protein
MFMSLRAAGSASRDRAADCGLFAIHGNAKGTPFVVCSSDLIRCSSRLIAGVGEDVRRSFRRVPPGGYDEEAEQMDSPTPTA